MSIGPYPFSTAVVASNTRKPVLFRRHSFSGNGEIVERHDSNEQQKDKVLEGLDLSNTNALSFGGFLNHLANKEFGAISSFIVENRVSINTRTAAKKLGVMVLAVASLLLLFCTTANKRLTGLNETYVQQNQLFEPIRKDFQLVSAEYEKYADFLRTTNVLGISQTTLYADEIGAFVPAKMDINRINIFPIIDTKKRKQIEVNDTIIEIAGNCDSVSDINELITQLSSRNWVDNTELISMERNESIGDSNFELRIWIKS